VAKAQTVFVCVNCGSTHPRWVGQCDSCGNWNTVISESRGPLSGSRPSKGRGVEIEFESLDGPNLPEARLETGISEFDRTCGGGLVPGSATLVGGDPGIGKSTLLLQVLAKLARSTRCIYVSGEESTDQIRLRASRLGLSDANVDVAAESDVMNLLRSISSTPSPGVVVIDSIQTVYVDSIDSAPGTVSQVRTSAQELIRLAKNKGFALILIGHVTKEGTIAGPRLLEHMVDSVMYFEGDQTNHFRILRSIKNRFGPTHELGVFQMTDAGLSPVENPSALFISQNRSSMSGIAIFAGIEGSRPLLIEIQALVASSMQVTPRRNVVGWDAGRLAMILAVLEARCGLSLAKQEVYLNVAGGLRVNDPAADLAVAAALISATLDIPASPDTVIFGEIGLSGEVRSVRQSGLRVKEAHKLGFKHVFRPGEQDELQLYDTDKIKNSEIFHLKDLVAKFRDSVLESPSIEARGDSNVNT
jgi:DNA repair protein RadA/Sms